MSSTPTHLRSLPPPHTPAEKGRPTRPPRIVVVGGGFVGLTLARRLQRTLHRNEAEVVLVDPSPSMTYQPFLAEAAAGLIEPRHIAVPLRGSLRRTHVFTGQVTDVDRANRLVRITLGDGTSIPLEYDELVLAAGSVSDVQPVPGLADQAVGCTSLPEAEALHELVLARLSIAADTYDLATRRAALTFVVIGGGFTGVEMVAELHSLAVAAARRFRGLSPDEPRFELIEADSEILPELPPSLAAYARDRLTRTGITVRPDTHVLRSEAGVLELSDGSHLAADTVVWAAGARANPLLGRLGLPTDDSGRLRVDTTFRVEGAAHVWAAGDGAAVPDHSVVSTDPADPGVVPICGATAQHAVRQARVLSRNLTATLRTAALTEYRHRDAGSVASLGRHRGVGHVYGVPLRGLPAWLAHRVYHLAMIPTWGRKVRVALGWLAAMAGGRDLTSLPPVRTQAPASDHGRREVLA